MPPHPLLPLPIPLLLLLLLLPAPLHAHPEFREMIPNGLNTDNSGITCEHLGHNDCIPGAPRNPFGLDFARLILADNQPWRQTLCHLDSDGDGLTNGQELGDPCCVWQQGDQPARADTLSHPGDPQLRGADAAPPCSDASPSNTPPLSPSLSPTPSSSPSSPSVSAALSPSPSTSDANDDPVCFPAHALITMADGSDKPMRELAVGDRVWVSHRETSRVFMFTHRVAARQFEFVTLRAADERGNVVASLSLTKGHYLYVNGRLERAGGVRVGDSVEVWGVLRRVVGVECARFVGLYNPQTVHGDLMVDGVRVSTYTTAVEVGLAHSLLAPLRLVYRGLGWSLSALEQGADRVVRILPLGGLTG